MAAVMERGTYGLSSCQDSTSSKSVIHVKLTDSAVKALEDYNLREVILRF